MKTAVLVALVLALPMSVMAADWSPTPMTISAPATVYYAFDGSELIIPVTVTTKPARVTFAVFTKGKADQMSRIRNGFLGWHYMDAIDTCVYFSPAYDFPVGTGEVTWSGQTHNAYLQEGNSGPVGAGEYTYYLWGYDYVSPRVRAVPPLMQGTRGISILIDEGPLGNPIDRPFFHGRMTVTPPGLPSGSFPTFTAYKWFLGNDPSNNELIQTCYIGDTFGDSWPNAQAHCGWDDDTFQVFYQKRESNPLDRATVWKMQWIPSGNAIRDEGWGPDLVWDAKIYLTCGTSSDGTYIYTYTHDLFEKVEMSTRFYIIDKEAGEMLYDVFLPDWTDFDQFAGGTGADYLNGGGPEYQQFKNGYIWGANFLCIKQMCDPHRYMETEDIVDFVRWGNKNGDWVSDFNWQETATFKWACFGESPPKNRTFDPDHLNWVLNMVGQFGAVTFDLFAPDGTGIGYFAIQGDAERAAGFADTCDNGTIYDGMYVDNVGSGADLYGFFYVAFDNFMGTISDEQVNVADAAPAAFAVAQNTPNPFNPTTTINFTIPQAGRVNVDVYNVAGQKVDTLVNDSMEAGNHTVTFDGANLAAGVYFYTVKAGEFSRTMKMTLLK